MTLRVLDAYGAYSSQTIHPTTGVISWQPIASQLGTQSVEVLVQDPEGGQSIQQFKIVVDLQTVNHAPAIVSTPIFVGSPGVAYQYQVLASDPDAGNTLTYQLLSAPAGVTIDGTTGLLSWANPTVGIYQIVVSSIDQGGLGAAQGFSLTVKDTQGATVTQSFTLTTIGDTEKPTVTLQATRTALNVGESVTYEARAIDNVSVAGLKLASNSKFKNQEELARCLGGESANIKLIKVSHPSKTRSLIRLRIS